MPREGMLPREDEICHGWIGGRIKGDEMSTGGMNQMKRHQKEWVIEREREKERKREREREIERERERERERENGGDVDFKS